MASKDPSNFLSSNTDFENKLPKRSTLNPAKASKTSKTLAGWIQHKSNSKLDENSLASSECFSSKEPSLLKVSLNAGNDSEASFSSNPARWLEASHSQQARESQQIPQKNPDLTLKISRDQPCSNFDSVTFKENKKPLQVEVTSEEKVPTNILNIMAFNRKGAKMR